MAQEMWSGRNAARWAVHRDRSRAMGRGYSPPRSGQEMCRRQTHPPGRRKNIVPPPQALCHSPSPQALYHIIVRLSSKECAGIFENLRNASQMWENIKKKCKNFAPETSANGCLNASLLSDESRLQTILPSLPSLTPAAEPDTPKVSTPPDVADVIHAWRIHLINESAAAHPGAAGCSATA